MSSLLRSLLGSSALFSPPDDPAAGGASPQPSASPTPPANPEPSPGPAAPDPSAPSGQAPAPAVIEAEPRLPESLLSAYDGEKKVPALSPAEGGKEAPAVEGDKKPAAADAKPADGDKKPAEAAPKPEGDQKPAPAKVAEPAPIVPLDPVLYGEILLPGEVGEGLSALKVTPVPELMTEFKTTLGKFGVAKEAAQPLADLHIRAMERFAANTRAQQYKDYGAVVEGWATRSMADPQIGGAGHQTAMGAIARMRDRFVSRAAPGSEQYIKDKAELDDFMNTTGGGSHPAFLKILHNVARMFDEPQIPMHIGLPPKNNGQKPIGRLRDTYDHPRSDPAKRQ